MSASKSDSLHFDRPAMPTVAIVGRPNVGKSALFNRIVGRRQAIVHPTSGVTRDRVTATTDWDGHRFMLVDTGGLGVLRGQKNVDPFDAMIRTQLQIALESADRIIFVVDVAHGPAAMDDEVAELLRPHADRVVIAANKADNDQIGEGVTAFKRLGFRSVSPVSSLQNRGIGDLLDAVVDGLPRNNADGSSMERQLKIAVIGRPNVGKSSLVNRLLGEERVLVSEVAGTTRDAVDIPLILTMEDGRTLPMTLIDTAGLKRSGKVRDDIEHFSMDRSETAIKQADVVLLVLDATNPATAMDKRICRLVMDLGKPCLMLLNKWDLASAETKQADLMQYLEENLGFMSWAKVQTCCAVSGYNFKQIIPAAIELADQIDVKVPTAVLNEVIHDAMERVPSPTGGKGRFKVFYAVHTGNRPPKFVLFVNKKTSARSNYLGYLESQLRRAFGLVGFPLALELRERTTDPERATRRTKPATKPGGRPLSGPRRANRGGPSAGKAPRKGR